MANLDLKIKIANTVATTLLLGSHYGIIVWHPLASAGATALYVLMFILQFLLIGMTIYQWLPKAPKDVFEAIGYWYLGISLLASSGTILRLWLLAMLVVVYHRLRQYPPRHKTDHALINAPFSMLTSLYVSTVLHKLWALFAITRDSDLAQTIMIILNGIIGLHLVDYSYRKDWVFALTTGWVITVRALDETDKFQLTHTVSLIVVGILVSAVLRTVLPQFIEKMHRVIARWSNRVGERTPLLS
ncbi:hypothetical protein BC940DRAFT_324201 [Gongronella butleri]|nr:hypothetical protein BC940DRAFT_324201 [Gongronella butleri]